MKGRQGALKVLLSIDRGGGAFHVFNAVEVLERLPHFAFGGVKANGGQAQACGHLHIKAN